MWSGDTKWLTKMRWTFSSSVLFSSWLQVSLFTQSRDFSRAYPSTCVLSVQASNSLFVLSTRLQTSSLYASNPWSSEGRPQGRHNLPAFSCSLPGAWVWWGEEGLADHLSASAQELQHCAEQVLPWHSSPLNNVERTHSRDVWDPRHSAAAALLLFLNSLQKLTLPSGLVFTLNHCPALLLSGWEVCWHQQKYNTHKISYKLMPPTHGGLSLCNSNYL